MSVGLEDIDFVVELAAWRQWFAVNPERKELSQHGNTKFEVVNLGAVVGVEMHSHNAYSTDCDHIRTILSQRAT